MVGIKHHTLAGGTGIKIPKSSYNEEHDPGATADVLTDHDKALHDALNIDADTLDGHDSAYFAVAGSTDAQTLDTLDSTDFEQVTNKGAVNGYCGLDAAGLVATSDLATGTANNSTFLRGDQTWAKISDGRNGIGFKQNITVLWNKNDGAIPDGFIEVSELSGTVFTVIKFVGGEEMTNITHSVYYDVEANVTLTVTSTGSTNEIVVTGAVTGYASLVNPHDGSININLAKSTAGDVTYAVQAKNPETADDVVGLTATVPGEGNIDVVITLPIATYLTIVQS